MQTRCFGLLRSLRGPAPAPPLNNKTPAVATERLLCALPCVCTALLVEHQPTPNYSIFSRSKAACLWDLARDRITSSSKAKGIRVELEEAAQDTKGKKRMVQWLKNEEKQWM